MEELGRAKAEIRPPAGQGEVTRAELELREADHLLVHGAVIEIRNCARLRPEVDQVPRDRRDHERRAPI